MHFDLIFFLKRPRVVISAGLPFDLRFLTCGRQRSRVTRVKVHLNNPFECKMTYVVCNGKMNLSYVITFVAYDQKCHVKMHVVSGGNKEGARERARARRTEAVVGVGVVGV